jgi:toxin YoeB
MGKFTIKIEKEAQKDLDKHFKAGNKAIINKISKIILELSIHPEYGTGQPERLKHELTGFWSRRINSKDRLIYKIDESIVTVFVVSAMGHYGEK